jgi:hypothetical protein
MRRSDPLTSILLQIPDGVGLIPTYMARHCIKKPD